MGKSEQTKQFIIEKIAPVFNKKGYLGTSLSDLIAATGLTKGALYGNFECKEDMAVAALEYNVGKLLRSIDQWTSNSSTSIDKLLSFIDFYEYYFPIMIEDGGCAFMNTAIDSDDTALFLYQKVQKNFEDWRNSLIQIVKKGQEEKKLKLNVHPESFADMMISMIEGGILLSKTRNSSVSLAHNLQFLRNYIYQNSILES